MTWTLSHRGDPFVRPLADRHYNRQHIGAKNFVPPGRCLVLVTGDMGAFWVSSWPFAQYVRHAWRGAWMCSAFRRESGPLASVLIREAVAATRARWGDPPAIGMVTFVDPDKTRRKRDPGRCFRRAGFVDARCPAHGNSRRSPRVLTSACAACRSETEGGLIALQLWPDAMPAPEYAAGMQTSWMWE